MKLGWHRLGLAATLLWGLGICLYLYAVEQDAAAQAASAFLKACAASPGAAQAHCGPQSELVFRRAVALGWQNFLASAPYLVLGPTIAGWNLLFLGRALGQWAGRYFRR